MPSEFAKQMFRQKMILDLLTDRHDKGCGNCGSGKMHKDLTVECLVHDDIFEPWHDCDQHNKCLRIYLLQSENMISKKEE